MKVTKETLICQLAYINMLRGFDAYENGTIGIYRLCRSGIGYSIHEVMNEGGGVRTVGNLCGMSARECYFFLSGIIESTQTKGE